MFPLENSELYDSCIERYNTDKNILHGTILLSLAITTYLLYKIYSKSKNVYEAASLINRCFKQAYSEEEIISKIKSYRAKKIETLVIGQSKIFKVPKEILALDHLVLLSICDTKISDLPKKIDLLSNLEVLVLSDNNFSRIPSVIGALKNLKTLSMSGNNLTKLHIPFKKGSKISKIDVSHNNIEIIPSSIERLKFLETLIISFNKIKKIYTNFSQLPKIKKIDLSHNLIAVFPSSLFTQSLEHFNACNNSIEELPQQIENAYNLRHFEMRRNLLKNIPKEIRLCKNLTFIDLSKNLLDEIPTSFGFLHNLQTIDLSYNKPLSSIPLSLMHLSKVIDLDLSNTNIPLQQVDIIYDGIFTSKLKPITLEEKIDFWSSYSGRQNIHLINLSPSEKADLIEWFIRLERTDQFENQYHNMASCVLNILENLQNSCFRNSFFISLCGNLVNCEDQALLHLIHANLLLKIAKLSELTLENELDLLLKAARTLHLPEIISKEIISLHSHYESSQILVYVMSQMQKELDLLMPWDNFEIHYKDFAQKLLEKTENHDLMVLKEKMAETSQADLLLKYLPEQVREFLNRHKRKQMQFIEDQTKLDLFILEEKFSDKGMILYTKIFEKISLQKTNRISRLLEKTINH